MACSTEVFMANCQCKLCQMTERRIIREDRLRELGFEDPSDEQRKEQLAKNIALKDWPK